MLNLLVHHVTNSPLNVKIYIKIAPTSFGAVTPSSGSALLWLPKFTVVKIVIYVSSVPD